MTQVSDNFKEQVFKTQMRDALLTLIELVFFENDGTIDKRYYTDNIIPIDSSVSGQIKTYQPSSFKMSLGEDKSDTKGEVTANFDPGDFRLITKLREVEKRPQINLWLILSSTPNIIEQGPMNFEVKDFTSNKTVVSVKLEVEPILDEPIPAQKFTPQLFPGLWEDVKIKDVTNSNSNNNGF